MPITRHPFLPLKPGDDWLRRFAVDEAAVTRLSTSLDLIRAKEPSVTKSFYALLFERFPGVRAMFPAEIAAQERKLLDTLVMVIEHVRDPQRVTGVLQDLGRRHVGYGARPEHYAIVCSILVECLAKEAGKDWSPQLETEWSQALALVSHIMIDAGEKAPVAPLSPPTSS